MKRPKFAAKLLARLLGIFRWQYFVPRLVVVLTVVAGVHYGLDPLLRWALITTGEAALTAKVELAELSTSLLGGEISLDRLAAANPHKPMRNLIEAESIHVEVDMAQLLRKRVVIHDGALRGLKFDSTRKTSGALQKPSAEETGPSILDPIVAAAQEKTLQWFDHLSGRVEQDLMVSLATPKVLDEIEHRWPQQYAALKTRAEQLQGKSKQIEKTFREVKKNPLRNLPQLEQLQKELAATEAEFRTTLAEIEALPAQAKSDRKAIDAARKQDEQFFREHLKITNVDAAELNRYLLGETASGYVTQTAYWIDQARRFIPKKRIAPPTRARGTNVHFLGRRQPGVLIERVELAGSARLGGEAVNFTGMLVDAASEPELHERPLRLTLTGTGAVAGHVVVELDRRSTTLHDSLNIDVPKLRLAHRTLGKADKLAVTIPPGEASIKADIKLDGEELNGMIAVRQASRLEATTPMLRDDRLAAVLHDALSGLDRLEATIELAGTLNRPKVKVESNIGPQLAAGVDAAMRKYLIERKDRLVAKVQGRVDEQLAKLETRRQEAQQELLGKLGEEQALVTELAALMGGKPSLEGLAVPKLSKSISLDKFKR